MRTPADGEVWRLGHLEGPLDFHYRWEGVGGSAQRLGDQTTGDGGGGGGGRVSGGRSENVITGREQKKFTAGGRGVRGRRSETLLLRGSKENHYRWEEGEGKEK